jgi:hypothetical protein
MHRIRPRTCVLSGATIGLLAGAAVYGVVSSSATPMTPAAFKAPVAKTAGLANCTAGTTLTKGVCVVHVGRTVTVPLSAASAAAKAKAAHLAGATPGNQLKSAGKKDKGDKDDKNKDKNKDGDKPDGSESGREGAGHEGAGDAEDATAKPAVKTPAPVATTAPVPVKAPVPTPAPVVTVAPAPVPVRPAAS